ncbi:MAG: MinD/ParA family protein [Phycisphaerales bacterium]|nr:MinD/ParA family protein [Phycisphaerales bacterium]
MTASPAIGLPRGMALRPEDQATRLRALVRDLSRTSLGTAPEAASAAARGPARIVAVASGKGGVGKTNIAVNLAVAFAERGLRSTLIDGDLGLANADVICGVIPAGHLGHVLDGERSIAQVSVTAPGGFTLVPGASGVAGLADLGPGERARLVAAFDVIELASDVVVIDCGAGIGPSVLSFLGVADLALIVSTPEPTSIADAYATIKCAALAQAEQWGARGWAERMALVVNDCGGVRVGAAVHERIDAVCRRFLGAALPLAGIVASDRALVDAVRARRPLLVHAPKAPSARAIRSLSGFVADQIGLCSVPSAAGHGWIRRFFRGS